MVNGINDNFNNKKIFLQASAGASYVEQINEVAQTGEAQGILYTDENQRIDLEFNENNTISNTQISQANQEEKMNELLIAQMQAEIDRLQSEYEGATKNRGFFGAIGDGISSLWGGGSSKIKNKITEYTKLLNGAIKDPSKIKDAYEKIMGCELTQDKMLEITQANQLANTLTKEQKQEICNKLKEQAANLSKELKEAHDGQGWFTKTIGFLNNGLGFGTTNIKAQAKIEEFQKLVNELNPDDPDFAAKYQAITGEALTEQSITGLLLDTEAYIEECKAEYEKSIGKKLSDKEAKAFEEAMLNELASQGINTNKVSKGTEVIYDFENTSQMASDIGAGIVVGIVTTVAVIAAPFTGGASLALAAGVGAVTNLAIKASDGLTSDAGYSFEQGVLDFASGAVDGLLAGVMAGGIAGSLSKNSAKIAAGNVAKAAARNAGKSGAQIFFGNMGKSVLRGSLIAAGSAASHYTLDTVGKTGIYNLTDGYEQLENPTSVMQNEDGTYIFVYDVKDKTTGEVIWQNIEIVDSVSSDENGNIVKGNVIKTYQSNDFNWKDFGTQVAISGVAGATGAAIGSVTGNINTSVAGGISKTAAGKIGNNVVGKVVGGVAEISADATLSLGADYLLASAQRGEWMSAEEFFSGDRIFNEGLNQIRGLIIGNLSAKYNNIGNSTVAGIKGDGTIKGTDGAETYYEVTSYNKETGEITLKDPANSSKTITITCAEAIQMGAKLDIVETSKSTESSTEDAGTTSSKHDMVKIPLQFFGGKVADETSATIKTTDSGVTKDIDSRIRSGELAPEIRGVVSNSKNPDLLIEKIQKSQNPTEVTSKLLELQAAGLDIDIIAKQGNLDENLGKIENLTKALKSVGFDESQTRLVTSFMFNTSAWINSDSQVAITRDQLVFILQDGANSENTYVLAPQPNGNKNLKSYTNAARDIIEISQETNLKLNPDNARVYMDLSEIEGDISIIVSDDCSITGNSIIEDTIKSLNATGDIRGQKKIYFSPTVLGTEGEAKITSFIEFYNKVSLEELNTIKTAMKNGETTLSDMDAYRLLSSIVDNNPKKTETLLGQIIALKEHSSESGKVVFKINNCVEARDYRQTEEYRNLSDKERFVIDYALSCGGQNFGYSNSGTIIAIEGYKNTYEFPDSLSENAKLALGIGKTLPTKGNSPNNNTPLARLFAQAVGIDESRIKVSGYTTPEIYLELTGAGYTTVERTHGGYDVEERPKLLIQMDTRDHKKINNRFYINGKECKGGSTIKVSYEYNGETIVKTIQLPDLSNVGQESRLSTIRDTLLTKEISEGELCIVQGVDYSKKFIAAEGVETLIKDKTEQYLVAFPSKAKIIDIEIEKKL